MKWLVRRKVSAYVVSSNGDQGKGVSRMMIVDNVYDVKKKEKKKKDKDKRTYA
jgi:hypothetical protein